jgi:hypothetical protein
MAKGSSGNGGSNGGKGGSGQNSGGKGGSGPAPAPGSRVGNLPSTTGKPSGGGRGNAPGRG